MSAMEYLHIIKHSQYEKVWRHSLTNELKQVAQGAGKRVKGTDTISFINYDNIPSGFRKDIKYGCIVVD